MLIAIASQAGLINEDGSVVQAKQAFFADAVGTTIGAVLGTSTISTYAESAAGVVVGGRTGITTLVTAGLFFVVFVFCSRFFAGAGFCDSSCFDHGWIFNEFAFEKHRFLRLR